MNDWSVKLFCLDDKGGRRLLGAGKFTADSEEDAKECAMQTWWDPRLETSGCAPDVEVEALSFPWNLASRDEVTLTDHSSAGDTCSATFEILEIEFIGMPGDPNCTIRLTRLDGSVVECFASELS